MKKTIKKISILFMSVAIVFVSFVLMNSFASFKLEPLTKAEAASVVSSGTLKTGVKWSLDSNGTLTFSGKGAIDFDGEKPPYSQNEEDDFGGYCDNRVSKIVVGNGITELSGDCFRQFYALTSVSLPDSLEAINENAFMLCTELKSVTIPKSVELIGESAFERCYSLSNVVLNDRLETIEEMAFFGCSELKTMTLPITVDYIGDMALGYAWSWDEDEHVYEGFKLYCACGGAGEEYAQDNDIDYEPIHIDDDGNYWCDKCDDYLGEEIYNVKVSSITTTSAKISWSPIEEKGVTYSVFVGLDGGEYLDFVAETTMTSATVKNLKPDKKYFVLITVTDDGENDRALSEYLEFKTLKASVATPKSLKATKTSSSVSLSWGKVSGASGYEIYKYTTKDKKYTKVGTSKTNSFKVNYLLSNTKYMYAVKAYAKIDGKTVYSKMSSVLSVTTSKQGTPAKVGGFKKTDCCSNYISVSWNKVGGSDVKYYVFRYDTAKKKYVTVGSTTSNKLTIKNLKANSTYKLAVQAYGTKSKKWSKLTTLSAATAPAAPKIKVSAGTKQATVSWSKVPGATAYWVGYMTSKNGDLVYTNVTSKTSYTFKKLKSGKTYYFIVASESKAGMSYDSNTVSAKIK